MRSHREGIEDEYHWSCPCGFGTDDETAWMYHECPPEEEEDEPTSPRSG